MSGDDIVSRRRIMAFDYGHKRIGVAMTDEGGIMAHALETIRVKTKAQALREISRLVEEYRPSKLVIGLPLHMNGSRGPAALKAEKFAALLAESTGLEVSLWDERLTSVWAERSLLEQNLSRSRRREVIDRVAATLMLQGYLDCHREKES